MSRLAGSCWLRTTTRGCGCMPSSLSRMALPNTSISRPCQESMVRKFLLPFIFALSCIDTCMCMSGVSIWMSGKITMVDYVVNHARLVLDLKALDFGQQQGVPFKVGDESGNHSSRLQSSIQVVLPEEEGAIWLPQWKCPSIYSTSSMQNMKALIADSERGATMPFPCHYAEVISADAQKVSLLYETYH